MKNLSLKATIYIVLSLLFVIGNFTAVLANPGRIEEPGFETVTYWAYSEDTADYDGAQSATWKTQGANSYLLSAVAGNIPTGKYAQIAQSVNFDLLDTIFFDCQLNADAALEFEARVLVGATTVWSQAVPNTATDYLQQAVDVSGYPGTQDLIFQIISVSTSKNTTTCYFDNIKIWGSHNDATWTTVENSFADSTNRVYMYGENFDSGTTKIGYYDGGNTLRQTDTYSSWGGGVLNWSECYFMDYIAVATAGTWHAVVLLQADDLPAAYADALTDPQFVADDSFAVAATAIPEFPEVMAAIGVAGICFGIYYWMRKKTRRVCGVT